MIAPTVLLVIHWFAGLIVLAVGLDYLEHISPRAKGLARMERAKLWAEALAWISLCIGGAGAVVTPLLPLERPTLQDACVLAGLAGIAICRRLKGHSCRT